MNKILVIAMIFAVILSGMGLAAAARPDVDPYPSKGKAPVKIPDHAREVAPGVFKLGISIDKGRIVEGYAIVDYREKGAKPGTVCGNDICEPGENARKCPSDCGNGGEDPDASSCFGFLAKGAKWRTVEPYMVDPANTENLDESYVESNMALDISKWEDAADGTVDGIISKDILGSQTAGIVDGADLISTDNKNEVYFGDVEQDNAIAITVVWGIFGGPPGRRELVEWDQVYDQVDFDWSAIGEIDKMDFENIATHELGHSVGLNDLYDSICSQQTMYGYADNGETNKRDLEQGDIAGILQLYR